MADFKDMEMLYTLFNATSAITAIVGTSIYNKMLVPIEDLSQKTINFYAGGNLSGGLDYYQRTAVINCRCASEKQSKQLALEVFNITNRHSVDYSGNKYFMVSDILSSIPPIDDADVYNTPLSVLIRRR